MKYQIFTDGGSRGNPGPAGIGVQVVAVNDDTDEIVFELASSIGEATNNEAEYKALLAGLEWLRDHKQMRSQTQKPQEVTEVDFYLDSQLVVEQIKKNWKLKSPTLRKLAEKAWGLIGELQSLGLSLNFLHVKREYNQAADSLVNRALDAAKL